MAGVYVPRSPTTGVLYGVVRVHVADFLADVAARTDGVGLPAFVTTEFRKFLRCGVLAHGFARVRCADCACERLVPFSCKVSWAAGAHGAAVKMVVHKDGRPRYQGAPVPRPRHAH